MARWPAIADRSVPVAVWVMDSGAGRLPSGSGPAGPGSVLPATCRYPV